MAVLDNGDYGIIKEGDYLFLTFQGKKLPAQTGLKVNSNIDDGCHLRISLDILTHVSILDDLTIKEVLNNNNAK